MLELVNVVKKFNISGNKEDERTALDHISLQVKPGEFITIIGGNGSGKSTTLNIVSGSLTPDSGKVTINGFDITHMPEYKRAGYFGRVFQDPMVGTAANMSVYENLEIAYARGRTHKPWKWGFSASHKKYFIEELKKFGLNLEDRLNQKVGVMSGGQRQALTLLMATMRQMPSERIIKRDYVRFCEGNKSKAKEEVLKGFKDAKEERKQALTALNNESLSKEERKARKVEIRNEYTSKISRFDLTKQILLLDEHTAALDPKTARKVLELTDKAVRDNHMTTLMVTHNMKDALTYGDRLIMFHLGHIILDVSGEKKNKLTVEDLLKMFEDADKKAEQ
ncbi:MAG: ATP-binding cassette domain-containing protein [Bacilli bacterium]|nr:ATP-binding cassette domain-containing protein [Bacilli bacterium]